jgi:HEAT repeat protein
MGEKAILPATIADSADIWPALLRIARNSNVPRGTRNQSVFWLGQAAGDAATANLKDIVLDNSVDREVRETAVFALSQRPREEGVPALIAVARTNKDPEIRKKALFWLGQSHDPRALDLFEEILTKR